MNFLFTNRTALDSDTPGPLYFWTIDESGQKTLWNPLDTAGSAWLRGLELIGRPVVLFIHGFNTTTQQALATTALLQAALPACQLVTGAWANRSGVLDYIHDEGMARIAAPQFLPVIEAFNGQVSVVCHSMGTRVFRWAVQNSTQVVQKCVLVESDDGRDCPQLLSKAVRQGLVVHGGDRDGALDLSRLEHAAERLGAQGARLPLPPGWEQFDVEPFLSPDPLKFRDNHSLPFELPQFQAQARGFLK